MISGCLRQLATVRTATPRYSANDSLVMRRACRSRSASPPVHVAITCMPDGPSIVADMINHRGDLGLKFGQKLGDLGKPQVEGIKARPHRSKFRRGMTFGLLRAALEHPVKV